MRYYIGTCEYKWSHKGTNMEQLWVRREVGDELFETVESNNWDWTLLRSGSVALPGDVYCRCDIFVETDNSKAATLFALKFPRAKPIPLAK